jgi:hypothetical protein
MSERKPPMHPDTRKVLNLLGFIMEMQPEEGSVYNQFVLKVAQQEEDLCWVTDAQWADWFQDYADKLSADERKKHNVATNGV